MGDEATKLSSKLVRVEGETMEAVHDLVGEQLAKAEAARIKAQDELALLPAPTRLLEYFVAVAFGAFCLGSVQYFGGAHAPLVVALAAGAGFSVAALAFRTAMRNQQKLDAYLALVQAREAIHATTDKRTTTN
jgi:hypothetical protein